MNEDTLRSENRNVLLQPRDRHDRIVPSQGNNYMSVSQYRIIAIILCVVSALSGISVVFSYIAALTWATCMVLLFDRNDFCTLLLPLTIFEGRLFIFSDFMLFKFFVVLYFARIILNQKISLNLFQFILFSMIAIYGVFCLPYFQGGSVQTVIFVITMFVLFDNISRMAQKEFLSRSLFLYAVIGISSSFYGLIGDNYYVGRFCCATADPNSAGLILVVSLIVIFYTRMISVRWIKFLLSVVILWGILLTQSTTAKIAIMLAIAIHYLIVSKKIKKIITISCIIAVSLFLYANLESVIKFIVDRGILAADSRVVPQLFALAEGDISEATSWRTDIWSGYMDYFFRKQNLLSQIFGGNVCGTYGIAENYSQMGWVAATHNTQIDLIMCLGIAGWVAFTIYYFTSLKKHLKCYYESKDKEYLMVSNVKSIIMLYSFSLSFFPSVGIMGLYLI